MEYRKHVTCRFETLDILKRANKSDGHFEAFFRFSFGLPISKPFHWFRRLPMIVPH